MRVLTIAHNAVALSNRQRVDALRRLPDVEVTLLTPPWWYEEGRRIDARSTARWRLGRTLFTGNGTRHVYLSGLFESVRKCTPDVIDLCEEPFSLVALQTLVARNLLAPHAALVVYSAVNVERAWRWPYRLIERVVLRNADGAHAPNSDVPPILHRRGLRGPAEVIPLGVDADRFASAEPLPLSDIPRPRIGFLGRFEPVKGLDVLLRAFALLRASDSSPSAALRRAPTDVPAPVPTSSLASVSSASSAAVLSSSSAQSPASAPEPSASSMPELSGSSVPEPSPSSVPEPSPSPVGAPSRASLVLAGDGSLRGNLAGPRVHVLPPLPFDQVPAFLKSLDVLVLPSVTIQLPSPAREATRVSPRPCSSSGSRSIHGPPWSSTSRHAKSPGRTCARTVNNPPGSPDLLCTIAFVASSEASKTKSSAIG